MLDVLKDSVAEYIDPELHAIEGQTTVADAAKEMVLKKLDSLFVLKDGRMTGIVTTADMLEKMIAAGKDPSTTKLDDIKNFPVIDIHKDASVIDAINMMNKHDIRRLLVMEGEVPIGTITRKQIIGNMGEKSIVLPELEAPNQIKCPYCESTFPDKESLSRHIDDIHIGKGLLEGNLSQK